MKSVKSFFVTSSFVAVLAVAAFAPQGAVAQPSAAATPAPAALRAPLPTPASTNAPVDVKIRYENGTSYSGDVTLAYPKGGSVNPSDTAKSVEFVNGHAPSGNFALTLNGPGTLTYTDGSTLAGNFVNGLIEGPGTYVKPNAFNFKGDFASGVPRTGTVSFANGTTYAGSFADGLPSGQGTLTAGGAVSEATGQWSKGILSSGYETFRDGARFDGGFDADGKPNGACTFRSAGGATLAGTWQHGLYAGPFVERYRDGTIWTVTVAPADSTLQGPTTIAFTSGNVVTGTLAPTGVLEGAGTYRVPGGPELRANFHNGQLDGPATLVAANETAYAGTVRDRVFTTRQGGDTEDRQAFAGPVDSNGRPNGRGVYRYANGQSLSGTWVHGRMLGKMIARLADGTSYSVTVKPASAVLRGPATIAFPNGDRATGMFANGSLSGPGSYVFASNHNRIDGTYEQGRLHGSAAITTPAGDRYAGTMSGGTVQ